MKLLEVVVIIIQACRLFERTSYVMLKCFSDYSIKRGTDDGEDREEL